MEFGKVANPDKIDFTFPREPDFNRDSPAFRPGGAFRLRVGTAQWSDRGLADRLFPPRTPPGRYLDHYGRAFETIELNATFYRVDPAQLENWASRVPASFRFCAKFPREVSHADPLDADGVPARQFADALERLRDRRGPTWLLLPPTFSPRRGDELMRFCERFIDPVQLAIEVRHPDWFASDAIVDDWAQRLAGLGTSAMITDVSGRRDVLHLRLTTPTALIRFVGNGKHPTDFTRLDDWIDRLAVWRDRGLPEAYLFLHQPAEDLNADVARVAIARINERLGLNLHVPQPARARQESLF